MHEVPDLTFTMIIWVQNSSPIFTIPAVCVCVHHFSSKLDFPSFLSSSLPQTKCFLPKIFISLFFSSSADQIFLLLNIFSFFFFFPMQTKNFNFCKYFTGPIKPCVVLWNCPKNKQYTMSFANLGWKKTIKIAQWWPNMWCARIQKNLLGHPYFGWLNWSCCAWAFWISLHSFAAVYSILCIIYFISLNQWYFHVYHILCTTK